VSGAILKVKLQLMNMDLKYTPKSAARFTQILSCTGAERSQQYSMKLCKTKLNHLQYSSIWLASKGPKIWLALILLI